MNHYFAEYSVQNREYRGNCDLKGLSFFSFLALIYCIIKQSRHNQEAWSYTIDECILHRPGNRVVLITGSYYRSCSTPLGFISG